MHYDVIIIGAGMSGLAAAIRMSYYDKRVCVLERHYAYGGLNSYYRLGGYEFDVGLHALTNYTTSDRHAPLDRILRQLRIKRAEFDLCPQFYSEIRFPSHSLRFSNDIKLLIDQVAAAFPHQADAFRRLIHAVREYDDNRLDPPRESARAMIATHITDPILTDMILCPVMFYGSAQEHDMELLQFVIVFKSLFCEGFARPRGGVRTLIKALVRKLRANGGRLRMKCGVKSLQVRNQRVTEVVLDNGERLTADTVLSCAGARETMRLCQGGQSDLPVVSPGRVSFVETIAVLDQPPKELGHDATIIFYNDSDRFTYARPTGAVDTGSGIVCCPNNYERHEDMTEGVFRVSWLANYDHWRSMDDSEYAACKASYLEKFLTLGERHIPGFAKHVRFTDMFTPLTITRYTGHEDGAVYGSPTKSRDGRTPMDNLFLCGTDQGYLGIIGALLSGITMANMHVLSGD